MSGAVPPNVLGLDEQGGSAFHAFIEPLRARSADVGVAAGEDHRRPVLEVEGLEAYYAVKGERGGAASERRGHGWIWLVGWMVPSVLLRSTLFLPANNVPIIRMRRISWLVFGCPVSKNHLQEDASKPIKDI